MIRVNQLQFGGPTVAALVDSDVAALGAGNTASDGYTFLDNDKILLTGQTDPIENGIYLHVAGALTRPTQDENFEAGKEMLLGGSVFVVNGTVYGDTQYGLSGTNGGDGAYENEKCTIDTDQQTWSKFGGNAFTRIDVGSAAISGTAIDGTTVAFVISSPSSVAAVLGIYKNGVSMMEGAGTSPNDYAYTSGTQTITFADAPQVGDEIEVLVAY